ncbi:pyridoxal 5'-phosphate synthase glutaminase subunit PdxT [Corynebacterium tapiri]|uniref:Pyridoxal 5'-phosphate synthase subunit PdxT n=1 Tax=Corynebacterium tapiri TaxID=1448266 RepID=A0A5C4U2I1_9CORY|nr:pyridoxal 5'-phosphate synthase glutaminase subunit PdxT [Corynebacterium tapiri]TNL96668.1 pyridoxal 5'-phosphate synthase glutaminase subunit PdxT [Corynebacterium tapiri]
MVVGVLALQGGVAEHLDVLESLGCSTRRVRRPDDFVGLDALVLPGGESTTLLSLLDALEMRDHLASACQTIPVLGTCAGLILLSRLGALDVDVERNAFGRQVDSAEATLDWGEAKVKAAFIRAPAVSRVGEGVRVMSEFAGRVVGVKSGRLIGASFHPELCGDPTLHRELLELV